MINIVSIDGKQKLSNLWEARELAVKLDRFFGKLLIIYGRSSLGA